MTVVASEATIPLADLDAVLAPRDQMVRERALGSGRYELEEGPFRHYRRTVVVEHLPDGQRAHVRQTVDFRLAIPYFAVVFVLPVRMTLRRIGPMRHHFPWWSPPCRLDAAASQALGTLCAASIVAGYLNTLLTQTIAFAADEFDVGNSAQGVAGGVVRVGGMLAFAVVALADRRGRRTLVLWTAALGIGVASLGSLAPSLPWLTATQFLARPLGSALLVVVAIQAVEEMPAGARAYAVSLLAMTTGLGAGLCVLALPLADLGESGWRIVYVIPLVALPLLRGVARNLHESRRFERPHVEATMAGHGRRFWLLGISALLVSVFTAPGSFFQNRYLEDERGFSAARISLLTVVTNAPGGLGIIIGGRMADARGRRIVGAIGLLGNAVGTALFFALAGWPLWGANALGAVVGGMSVPALSVYGPELFPTSLRGKANGLLTTLGLTGSLIGLVLVGWLSDRIGSFALPISLVALGPVMVAVLVLVAFPETAKHELEELNPEDRLPPPSSP